MKTFFAFIAVVALCMGVSACTDAQLAKYTSAATATGNVLKQVGNDIVTFDCNNAGLIYVIAKDANASARVQAALAHNMTIAQDACPAITGAAAVTVVTAAPS